MGLVDTLTKVYQFLPIKSTIKTPKVAQAFVENIYRLYGVPTNIVNDCNHNFDSHFWQAIFKRLDTLLSLKIVDHPRMDDQTKWVNQVLEDMLQAYVSKK